MVGCTACRYEQEAPRREEEGELAVLSTWLVWHIAGDRLAGKYR